MLPSSFDLRHNTPACAGFKPLIDQGGCGACVVASLATVLSIQACMGKRQTNLTYSAQRIWDCYAGDCALGVHSPLIDTFFPYVLQRTLPPFYAWVSRLDTETPEHITGSNYTQCASTSLPLASRPLSVQAHRNLDSSTTGDGTLHRQALKEHLFHTHHPVMAVARMTPTTFNDFILPYSLSQLQAQAAFDLGASGHVLHAVTVIGWRDADGAWLVQNSMGADWQDHGIGWVRGALEDEWYSFQLDSDAHLSNRSSSSSTEAPAVSQNKNNKKKEPATAAEPSAQVVDLPFLVVAKPVVYQYGDTQIDVIVFLLTCMCIGCLAWMLCFCMR